MIKVKLKKLDLDTCIIVRRLRLNKRGKRAGKKIKESLITNRQGSISQNNLIIIEPRHSSNIHNTVKADLVSTQSLKPKNNNLITYLSDAKLDLYILTETWLTEEDDSWVSCSDLNITNYRLGISNQINRRGEALHWCTRQPFPPKNWMRAKCDHSSFLCGQQKSWAQT